jgi:hypothetical protein
VHETRKLPVVGEQPAFKWAKKKKKRRQLSHRQREHILQADKTFYVQRMILSWKRRD